MSARRIALAAVVLSSGCFSPTEACGSSKQLRGTWTYSALQETPVRATLTGTLNIQTQSCADFTGTIDIVETTGFGSSRRLAGPVRGTLVDSSSARFVVTLADGDREHLGRFAKDSVRGTWIVAQTSSSAAGSFAGRLEAK